MPVTVKKVVLWRRELENKPSILAGVLEPLAGAQVDLEVVMGYRYPGSKDKAAVEVFPVAGKRAGSAARSAGFEASSIAALLVQGDNKLGLGHTIAKALGEAGINIDFLVALVLGRRYSAVIGFENDADAARASNLIKKATGPRKPPATRRG
jgi:hypothetical protein